MDYRNRLKNVQKKMDRHNLDLIVFGSSPDTQYISGSNVDWRRSRDLRHPEDCLFVPREGDPLLMNGVYSVWRAKSTWIKDVRNLILLQDFKQEVQKALDDLVSNPKRVGIGEYTWSNMTLAVQSKLKGAEFINIDGFLDEFRMIKEPEEIRLLKEAADMTEKVMERVVNELDEGISPRQLALNVEYYGRSKGAVDISFLPSGTMYKTGSKKDTSIAFDVGFVFNGYCSDWGRSFYYGTPEPYIKEAYSNLMASVVDVTDEIMGEVQRTDEIFPFIEKQIGKAGLGEYLKARHPLREVGHQIGVELHETPWLRPEENVELQEGMVFCVEPKLWHNGYYNVRVEDMILIKNGKAESLTIFDRDLFKL
jgi:Xaa-Pro aminopeptidase